MYERHSAWCTERTERDMLSAHSEKYGTSGQIFLSSNFPRKVFEVWNRWPRDPSDSVISPSTKGVDPCILRKLGLAIWLCITHIHTFVSLPKLYFAVRQSAASAQPMPANRIMANCPLRPTYLRLSVTYIHLTG